MDELIERLRNFEGSDELGNGDFSLMTEAADALDEARAERKVIVAETIKYAGKSGRLEAKVYLLTEAISAYKSEFDNPAKDYVLRAKRRDDMFALLHDHIQENK